MDACFVSGGRVGLAIELHWGAILVIARSSLFSFTGVNFAIFLFSLLICKFYFSFYALSCYSVAPIVSLSRIV